jgi:GNAT superfamily N-acetyltransferase
MLHMQNIGGRGTRYEVLEHGVDPDHQGLGVGTALLVASLDEASPGAIVELRVAEKSPAAEYYCRRGFELDSARSGHVLYYDKNDPSREYRDPLIRLTTTAGALAEHALRAVDLGAVLAKED